MADEKVSKEDIDAIVRGLGAGAPPPSDISEWIIVRHPSTGEPIYYMDPKNAANKIPIPAAPAQGPEKPPTPLNQLQRLDAQFNPIGDPQTPAVYVRDPATGTPFKLEAGKETSDPSKWETREIAGATVIYDPGAKAVVGTIPAKADAAAKRSGEYRDMIDPNDPTGKRVIAKVDTGSNEIYSVSRDPTTQKQIVTTPNRVLVFNDDGTVANTIEVTPNMPATVFTVGNTAFVFDPATKTITKGPEVEEPATVGISTQNEWYVFFDKSGKEVGRSKNPNYQGPQQTAAPPTSLTAPTIPRWNPTKGVWEDVPNTGRLTIGEAAQTMIKDLTGQTVDPNNPLTLDEANTVLTAAINKMNADAQQAQTAAGAAQNILTGQQQGAQTGAGLLQQRQATTQNLIQQGLGVATSTGGRYGNYSGGMLSPVPGLGQALVSGAANFATELGGGQAVFDTAVRMVQAADPNNSNPDRATAVATLTQIMDRYKQSTGQDYPTVAATKALAASTQNQGLQAPATVPPPLATTPWQRADQQFGAAPAGNALAAPGVAGTVQPGSPMYLGTQPIATATQPRSAAQLGFTAPDMFAQAGIGGMGYR